MIAGLKPYAEMKDSGVEWLGAVPAHWDVRRLKYLLRERDSRSKNGKEQLLRVSQYTGITERKRDDGAEGPDTRAASLVGYKVVDQDDLTINIMLAWNGSLGVSPYDGIVSPAYGVYRFNAGVEPMFFHHLLRSPIYKTRIKTASRGVVESRLRLYTDDLYRIEALLPPKDEQAAIVRFVDHADRRIRRAIAAKQKLIRLLEEQKRAIIHRAVTRGLDPDVRLKPSGVEWLGDVPEHWRVLRAKNLFVEVDKRSSDGRETLLSLRMRQGLVPHNDVSTIPIPPESLIGFKRVEPGQIVMNRMRASIGMFGVAPQSGIVSPDYAIFEANAGIDADYYVQLFKTSAMGAAFRSESKGLGTGSSGFMRLYTDRFGAIPVPVPSPNEQIQIVEDIQQRTNNIEVAQVRATREIDLLREFRVRLIADVVAGKVDVRDASANLPELIEPGDFEFDADEENEDDSMEEIAAEDQAA